MELDNKLFVVYQTPDNEVILLACDRPRPSVRNSDLTPTSDFIEHVLMKHYELQGFNREELAAGHVLVCERGYYIQYISK
jgi:hypothetical protein